MNNDLFNTKTPAPDTQGASRWVIPLMVMNVVLAIGVAMLAYEGSRRAPIFSQGSEVRSPESPRRALRAGKHVNIPRVDLPVAGDQDSQSKGVVHGKVSLGMGFARAGETNGSRIS